MIVLHAGHGTAWTACDSIFPVCICGIQIDNTVWECGMKRLKRVFFFISTGLMAQQASAAPESAQTRPDYFNDRFEVDRVLDWGDRPVWSPDGKRIAFTQDYREAGPAYEMVLATREVHCITCQWGASGLVLRIYYLPDSSFLIVGPSALGTAETPRRGKPKQDGSELYWMPADGSLPPQPLKAQVLGEVALDSDSSTPGQARIAWGDFAPEPRMLMGNIINDGKQAFLVNRSVLYTDSDKDSASLVSVVETYDFVDDGKSISFATMEKGSSPRAAMYKLNVASGTVAAMPHDGQHNETHSFPDVRFGLEESNRASDPSGPYRGISGHRPWAFTWALKVLGMPDAQALGQRYGGKTFDLFVLDWQTDRRRRLTNVSDIGGQAHQSSPGPDGRQIVFTMQPPAKGPFAGKGGLYVGTFSPVPSGRR